MERGNRRRNHLDPEDAWLALALAPGVTPGYLARLLERCGGDPAAALRLLAGAEGRCPAGPQRRRGCSLDLAALLAAGRRERARVEALGARVVSRGCADYPAALERLADPPPVLFVAGTLPREPGVAIIGSRAATPGGRRLAADLGAAMAACGLPVVSGLARGIDAAAHEGALAAGGPTTAVLGSGLDRIYPPEHAPLASRVRAAGALVTEFALGTPPRPWHFPRRNRLLAALARAVVVVEAGERSGALITARHALDLGVDVLAVPGPPGAPLARGSHALIKDGAGLVEGPEDILAALGFERACRTSSTRPSGAGACPAAGIRSGREAGLRPPSRDRGSRQVPAEEGGCRLADALTADQALVLAALADGPASLDALAERCSLGAGAVAAALLGLELAGLVDPPSGQTYSARPLRRGSRRSDIDIGGDACGSGSSTS